jgi:cytochrome c
MENDMKTVGSVLAIGAIALGVAPAFAQDGAQLAQSKGCMTCHAVDQTKMGPSFKGVAAKYAGRADAAATLLVMLRDGQNHPKANATEAELQQIIAYVLAVH